MNFTAKFKQSSCIVTIKVADADKSKGYIEHANEDPSDEFTITVQPGATFNATSASLTIINDGVNNVYKASGESGFMFSAWDCSGTSPIQGDTTFTASFAEDNRTCKMVYTSGGTSISFYYDNITHANSTI